MEISELQYKTLLRYLDNELSYEEEQLFIEEMASNTNLQQSFDTEIMLRQEQFSEENVNKLAAESTIFEPADDHIKRVNAILGAATQKEQQSSSVPVVSLWGQYKTQWLTAASILLLLTSIVIYFYYADRETGVAKKFEPQRKDTVVKQNTLPVDTLQKNKNLLAYNLSLTSISTENYSQYKSTAEDPIEIGKYLGQYEKNQYQDLLNASSTDYGTKGMTDEDQQRLIEAYMLFYKGLAYLETHKPEKAARLFKKSIVESKDRTQLRYHTQWYLLHAYLRLEDRQNAEKIVKEITQRKGNPYQKKAAMIANLLQSKK